MLSNLLDYFKYPQSRVIGLTYFSMSILFGSWVARIPDVQNKLALSDSGIGWAILSMSAGGFIITPFAGALFTKMDLPKAIFLGLAGMAIFILLPILATSLSLLCVALFFFGLSQGFLNIAMNTAASALEASSGKALMSTCHGMFSVGAMLGAGLGSLALGQQIPGLWHFLGASGFVLLLTLFNSNTIKSLPNAKVETQQFSWPPKVLWTLTFICFCSMLGEGVVASWSGIFLEKTLNANEYLLGIGFAGFSATMAIGRFSGDAIIPKYGIKRMLWLSLLIGAIGLIFSSAATLPWMAILGFSVTGLGMSLVVPIVFSAAAKLPGVAPSHGIATVAGIGILGFLGGPPVIGFIADYTSMRTGILLTALITVFAFGMAFLRKE